MSTILTHLEIHCSSSKEGIANLRQAHQSRIVAISELENTNIWLDSEDEILAKVSPFTRDQVEVTLGP
jgi:sarcosine oxidase/L-pipecolate oxidase